MQGVQHFKNYSEKNYFQLLPELYLRATFFPHDCLQYCKLVHNCCLQRCDHMVKQCPFFPLLLLLSEKGYSILFSLGVGVCLVNI